MKFGSEKNREKIEKSLKDFQKRLAQRNHVRKMTFTKYKEYYAEYRQRLRDERKKS